MSNNLLEAVDLVKYFPIRGGVLSRIQDHVRAVDNVSMYIKKGETVGLVGESGCGKTTFGRTLLRLIEPMAGEVTFEGVDITSLSPVEMRTMRRNMQIVFQDPVGALNPRMTIKNIIGEPLKIHGLAKGRELTERVIELMTSVGLKEEHLYRFPHEFSGGQRQRIGIARSIALNPSFLLLDEPTSALDVSVQAQILNLIQDLQKRLDLTYLFISHNLAVIKYISDRIYVMYLGKIVESAESEELFKNPHHSYTKALLSAIPIPDPDLKMDDVYLQGEVPSAINPPKGCRFHPRCPNATDKCKTEEPELVDLGNEHYVLCHMI